MAELMRIQELLEDINKSLSYTSEDGKVIHISEVFKTLPELSAKYADLKARFDDLETRVRERKWANLPGLEDEKPKFSLFKALYAIATGDWSQAQLEADVFRQTRDMGTSTDSSGGYLVPYQAVPELIEMLRAESVVSKMGATLLDNLTGSPVEIPKQTGGATAYWVGENEALTASEPTLGQLQFTPKSVGALVKLSNRLLRMSNPSAEQLVRNDVATVISLAIDLAALRGTGANGQPIGIANTSGINTVSWLSGGNPQTPNFDLFYDMEYELAMDNALKGKLGYVFNPCVKRSLSKLKVAQFSGDTGGEYIIRPMDANALTNYIGYPFAMTTLIPANLGAGSNQTEIYFGNWQELIVAQWAGIEILPSKEAGDAFAKNQTWIRIIIDVDIGLRHAESFCLATGVKNS
jgi:HK97 family phage major capsid protein